MFFTETHESPERGLPQITGYTWESVFRPHTRRAGGVRGSGGVAVLFRDHLRHIVTIERRDAQARYLWIRIRRLPHRDLFIAVCYFPPSQSDYVASGPGQSPFEDLSEDISDFAHRGEVILLGDFNARTSHRQADILDFMEDPIMLPHIQDDSLSRTSADTDHEPTDRGRWLLQLLSTHGMVIYNGMSRWPRSSGPTCFPFSGGTSVIDYVMGPPALVQSVHHLTVDPAMPSADHALVHFTLTQVHHTPPPRCLDRQPYHEVHFDHQFDEVYSRNLSRLLRPHHLDALPSTQDRWELVHTSIVSAAHQSFPVTTHISGPPPVGLVPCNGWYDEECKQLRRRVRLEEKENSPFLLATMRDYKRLVRCKKRQFLARNEEELRSLLFSCDSKEFWRKFLRLKSQAPLTDSHVWSVYTTALYDVPDQPDIDLSHAPRPQSATLFTPNSVRAAVSRMKNGRAKDHDGLQTEYVIHGIDALASVLSRLFNESVCTGLPHTWLQNTIVPIHKSGDPMDPSTYRTIMIGHVMAKVYATVLEDRINDHAEMTGLRARGQAGFRREHSTLDHILTLRAMIEEARSRRQRLFCCFVDFRKAFDTVPRFRLFQRLHHLGFSGDMQWAVMALYERVTGRVRTRDGLSDEIHSTIGVKQGCPLSPTLFGLYIDELEMFIQTMGGEGALLSGSLISTLLYADDVVLISSSIEGLQAHLDALHRFCQDRGLTVNLGKTKVMVFNTSDRMYATGDFRVIYDGQPVELVKEYTYLGVVFRGPRFTMTYAARDRISKGYASLALLERQCAQSHFQHPDTKSLLFDTLARPAAMYASPFWAPDLDARGWRRVERLQVLMLSRMIRAKSSVPHEIMLAEFGATPLALEAAFQAVTYLHRIREFGDTTSGRARLPWLALTSSMDLAGRGDTHCWYSRLSKWMTSLGLDMDRLPPFRYSLDDPRLCWEMTRHEISQVIRADLLQLHTYRTWIYPTRLPTKMATYRDHFLRISDDGLITSPGYTGTHLSHSLRISLGQLRVSSHRLDIEAGRMRRIGRGHRHARETRICPCCTMGEVETEEHFICRCPLYYEIRGRFHCLFRDGFAPLSRVIDYEDQHCLALFVREATRHRDRYLRERPRDYPDTQGQRRQEDGAPQEETHQAEDRPYRPPRGCTYDMVCTRRRALLHRGRTRRFISRRYRMMAAFRRRLIDGDLAPPAAHLTFAQICVLIAGGRVDGQDFQHYFGSQDQ